MQRRLTPIPERNREKKSHLRRCNHFIALHSRTERFHAIPVFKWDRDVGAGTESPNPQCERSKQLDSTAMRICSNI